MFKATADVIGEQSEAARENPAETLSGDSENAQAVVEMKKEAARQIRNMDETQPILLGGSLIQDSGKIADLLTGTAR